MSARENLPPAPFTLLASVVLGIALTILNSAPNAPTAPVAAVPSEGVADSETPPQPAGGMMIAMSVGLLIAAYMGLGFITHLLDGFVTMPRMIRRYFGPSWKFYGLIDRLFSFLWLLGLSLLPLASLLLFLPVVLPDESVLANSIRPQRTWWSRLGRRLFGLFSGTALLIAIIALSMEIVSALQLSDPYFGTLARKILSANLLSNLPPVLVNQWPYIILCVYSFDLVLLFAIGKVPLSYNYRNIIVRWRIALLTVLAFVIVVTLLTFMLGFLNGLNAMTANSGNPANIIALSDGATDELFSNFTRGDISRVELEVAKLDRFDRSLPQPVGIKTARKPGSDFDLRLCSKETYYVINQKVPTAPGVAPRRRFVQLRGIDDPFIADKVHEVGFIEGKWFDDSGVVDLPNGQRAVPVVMGEGAASTFGEDVGKPRLQVGDTFPLGDLTMAVVGVIKSEGQAFSSEIWTKNDRVAKEFGKQSFTRLVMRVDDDSAASAEAMAFHYANRFQSPRLRAVTEPTYYRELSKTNDQLFSVVVIVALIMAIGGIFGVMNTMFAAIAQRTRDIGVMRILGFKRWQILVSFMLESLFIALIGGVIGCMLGSLADGFTAQSILSSGAGGGKTVVLTITVDTNVLICSILFTLVMGRLGGLLPALSGMRLNILDSLR